MVDSSTLHYFPLDLHKFRHNAQPLRSAELGSRNTEILEKHGLRLHLGSRKQSVSMHAWFQNMIKFNVSDHQEKL